MRKNPQKRSRILSGGRFFLLQTILELYCLDDILWIPQARLRRGRWQLPATEMLRKEVDDVNHRDPRRAHRREYAHPPRLMKS